MSTNIATDVDRAELFIGGSWQRPFVRPAHHRSFGGYRRSHRVGPGGYRSRRGSRSRCGAACVRRPPRLVDLGTRRSGKGAQTAR